MATFTVTSDMGTTARIVTAAPSVFVLSGTAYGPAGVKGDTGAQGERGAGVPANGTAGQALVKASDTSDDTEWHTLVKDDVGLGDVDDTSDLNKPISTAAQTALDAKAAKASVTGATKTKVTYNSDGIVTAGADATTADIADSTNKRYVTDTDVTLLGNTSGTNTGDQDLSGLVPKTTTVAGHALSADVTIDASDVGLGSVTNDAQLKAANLDTDGTLAADSDAKVPSQKAVKTYVDANIGGGGAVTSVNTQTGTVVLDADDIGDTSTTHKFVTAADITVLADTSGSNTGDQDLSGLVPKTTTVAGHALSANVTLSASDVGLGSVTNDAQLKAASNLSDVSSASTAFNNVSPLTTLGDIIYENGTPAAARLAGNTAATKQYLSQTGTGSVSAAPAWAQIAAADLSNGVTGGGALVLANAPTLTGELTLAASTTSHSGLTMPAGVAPTSPVNGDIWFDGTHLIYREAGASVTLLGNMGFTMNDGAAMVFGSSSGTKIGTATTQKIGFFGTTPVVQQTGDILTALSNLGLIATPTIASTDLTGTVAVANGGTGNANGQLVPTANLTYNLGSTGNYYSNVYAQAINLNSGLTISGATSGEMVVTGNMTPVVSFINTSSAGSGGFICGNNSGSAITSSQRIAFLLGAGYTGAGVANTGGMTVFATQNWTSSAAGTEVHIEVTPNGGTPGTRSTAAVFGQDLSLTLSGNLSLPALNIVTDTTTGMKIATGTTQKLGFYNATPIVQPGATTDLGVVLSNLGLRASGTAYPVTTSGTVTLTGTLVLAGATITNTGTLTLPTSTDTLTGRATTDTLSNKRMKLRVSSVTQSATPSINSDNMDIAEITGLAQAITSMTSGLSGTPNDGDNLLIRIKDNGTARAITWGASFTSSGVATLLATTAISKQHTIGLMWDAAVSKWVCMAVDATGY